MLRESKKGRHGVISMPVKSIIIHVLREILLGELILILLVWLSAISISAAVFCRADKG